MESIINKNKIASRSTFNPRVESMKPSATLAMTAKANERLRAGFPVIGLSAGEPDFDTPQEISDAAIEAIRDGFTHYTNNAGIPQLREAICEKLARDNGIHRAPTDILCSNGAKQSIAQALSVLCRAGDEVLIPAPYWVSYPEMVRFAGAEPMAIPTGASTNYRITPDQLKQAITSRTRVLILCSPSNPTGAVYSPGEIRALAEVLDSHPDIFVISDEIYEYITYEQEILSIASLPNMRDRTITVNGFSKAYAMTGWRLGYMAAESSIVKACSKLQSQFTSAPSSISQKAGLKALEMSHEPITKMVSAFRERRDFILEKISEIEGINCPVPDGAFYIFPDISEYLGRQTPDGTVIDSSSALCFYVLESANVALVPGEAFGGPNGIRISYAASMSKLDEAMKRIKSAFSTLS